MNKPRIAFFGLGIMGGGMARRLLANGFPLALFNRNAEKAKPLVAEGAELADSPRAAAARAEVIVSMVADDNASRSLWLGDNGALAGSAPGTAFIECSTLTAGWVRELATAAEKKGCDFFDAPVTGSKAQAASGELTFLVGGPTAKLDKIRPVLAAMSKAIVPVGPVGSGAMLKLINNFVCGVEVAALAEGVAMIERSGLDPAIALEFLSNGAAGSPLVKTIAARIKESDYTPNFYLKLLTKDLGYAIQEGEKVQLELKTASAALQRFQNAIAAGHGDKDMAAVVEPIRSAPPAE